jgi:hypothetical protein
VYDDKANTVRAVLRRGAPALENAVLVCTYGYVMSDESILALQHRELALLGALRVTHAQAQAASHTAAVQRLFSVTPAQTDAIARAARCVSRAQLRRMTAALGS